jgi:LEA14-like dessication related protein
MKIKISFGEITQKHVNISFAIDVYNPNNLDVSVKDIQLEIKNETSFVVGEFILPDTVITGKENTSIIGTGMIDIESLNADELTVNMASTVIGHIAGYDKSIPVNVTATVVTPDLKDLLPSKFPTEAIIKGDYHMSLRGLIGEITFKTNNPNNIEFIVKDITLTVYRVDKRTKREVAVGSIEDGVLKANSTTTLEGRVIIPYRRLIIPPLGGELIPNYLEIEIKANLSVKGLNSYFWVAMSAYQDLHIIKKDREYTNPEDI